LAGGIELKGPDGLETLAIKELNGGNVREALKLLLRAAKGYESSGKKEDAARVYKYLGLQLLEKTGSLEKARPSLLKSAYLYIALIEDAISYVDVDMESLDEYCLNVLEIFLTLNDEKNLVKYASQFASIYEELGKAYQENNDISEAIRAYESAYRHYKLIDDEDSYKRVAEVLLSLYGDIAESRVNEGKYGLAAEAFLKLATYTRAIFGYDIHYSEMMDTAAKNFEKASKLAYSEGDLDETTSYLVKSEYAYLLARNFSRAKLIGVNTARMLNQVISAHRAQGEEDKAAVKLLELAEVLLGVGKMNEAMVAYKKALEAKSELKFRVEMRVAILKYFGATKTDPLLLDRAETVEFYLGNNKAPQALEIAERTLEGLEEWEELKKSLHSAEGFY